MTSGHNHKYSLHVVLLVLTTLTKLPGISSALAIRDPVAPAALLFASSQHEQAPGQQLDFDTEESNDRVDKDVVQIVRSDLLRDSEGDGGGGASDQNSIESDGTQGINIVTTDYVEQQVVVVPQGESAGQGGGLLYSSNPSASVQDPVTDKQIDQVHTSEVHEEEDGATAVPPQTTTRPRFRPTTTATTTIVINSNEDSDSEASGSGRKNNHDDDDQTNSSRGDKIAEETTTPWTWSPDAGETEGRPENECILGTSDVYLAWWINNDGSLRKNAAMDDEYGLINVSNFVDLSGISRSEGTVFDKLLQRLYERRTTYIPIKFLSLARNSLSRAPYSSLYLVGSTLEYLSMAGNNFSILSSTTIREDYDWATFPEMNKLKELDLRSCKISAIHEDAFADMQRLRKMYLADNNLITLSAQTFASVRNLVHLDVSYNNIEYKLSNFYTNPFELFTRGLEIDEFAFAELTSLKFLDFSHTRLEPNSMRSFAYLPSNLEQLSLCYTGIIVIGLGMFQRMPNLKVLDLSGNSPLTGNLNRNTFDGLQESLEILAFENSSVKHLDWLDNLNSLKMLKLSDNNINLLSNDTFKRLPKLDILDLSENHIGNWFSRVFEHNTKLRILNLRSNNINVITTEMMKDFAQLAYLGLANNNFICNCKLRDLLDQALRNAMPGEGSGFIDLPNISDLLITEVLLNYVTNIGLEQPDVEEIMSDNSYVYSPYVRWLKSYVRRGIQSFRKIRTSQLLAGGDADAINPRAWLRANVVNRSTSATGKRYVRYKSVRKQLWSGVKVKRSLDGTEQHRIDGNEEEEEEDSSSFAYNYSEEMSFNFQLLDFDEQSYTCFNATTNEEYFFTDLESCLLERASEWQHLIDQLRPHSQGISIVLIVIFVMLFFTCIAYYKWWYIRYFFILVKNATILSFLNKESGENGSRKSFGEISRSEMYQYDVFVSYCDENRDWVINELLPNIEQRQEINICMHERDFVVGLSILENIIACMDRAKCLLLVVSQSFLLSQWCQFEMHLAQHRLLETCRERLVLILLEDIPKRKRPKTLGYLMKTKTYIKWPEAAGDSEKSRSLCEERKIFWRRLRRALIDTDWESDANS